MISHYVDAHRYAPPAEFLSALRESGAPLSQSAVDSRIWKHLEKLDTAPEPEDILVPYYSIKLYWHRDAFGDLDAFLAFLSHIFPMRFDTCVLLSDGFAVITETRDPEALFRDVRRMSLPSGRAPFKCTFTLVHLGSGGGEILAEGLRKR